MISITAVIRSRAGQEETMKRALLDVARHVREAEPAAMDRHNSSAAVARFFATAKPILDGEVVLHMGEEVSAKS